MAVGLTMPLYVTVDDVITRMQLSAELNGIDEVLSSGIIGAQLHVERVVDGKLQRQSHSRKFFLDSTAFSGIQPNGVFRLELPSGFIRQDTPVVVSVADNWKMSTNLETMESTDYEVDYDRGYILIDAESYADKYVRVECDTGYDDGSDPSVPMESLPNPLYEAIMSMVPVIMDASQTTNRNDEAEKQYKKCADHAFLLLQPYTRMRGFSFRPMV